MRYAWIGLALMLAACGQPEQKAAGGSSGPASTPVTQTGADAFVGVWSFDRTCASGDGMRLNADNSASFDEWGQGTWAIDSEGRLVLDLAVAEPGVGDSDRRETVVITVAEAPSEDLNGELLGAPPRALNARRCS